MIKWKTILNPWAEIRRLREANAYLEGRMDELQEWAREETRRAFNDAADHYWQRNRMVEEQNKHLLEQMTNCILSHQFP